MASRGTDAWIGHSGQTDVQRRADLYRSLGNIFRGAACADATDVRTVMAALSACWAVGRDAEQLTVHADAAIDSFDNPDNADALVREHARLFGEREFSALSCAISPCEIVYVAVNEDEHIGELQRFYATAGYDYSCDLSGHCDCVGHIAVELGFVAFVLEHSGTGDSEAAEAVFRFMAEHLLTWAPLFAVALGRHAEHPVMRFAALAAEQLFGCESRRLSLTR